MTKKIADHPTLGEGEWQPFPVGGWNTIESDERQIVNSIIDRCLEASSQRREIEEIARKGSGPGNDDADVRQGIDRMLANGWLTLEARNLPGGGSEFRLVLPPEGALRPHGKEAW